MKTRDLIHPPYTYRAEVIAVVDGDTVDLRLELGMNINIELRVRLARINAPEMHVKDTTTGKMVPNPKGVAAKAFLENTLQTYGPFVKVTTIKDKKEKFGRLLAEIYANVDTIVSLSDSMLLAGHAVRYNG